MPLPDGRLLLVVAHPDDETVGAGALLARHPDAWVLHLTDGAPRDPRFIARGFSGTREEYAAARRRELRAALALAGLGAERLLTLEGMEMEGVADQEAVDALPRLTAGIAAACRALRPRLMITLAYEGGHPDHDAAALAARAALRDLQEAPALWELPLYHAGPQGMRTQSFLPGPAAPAPEIHLLTPGERELKERMLACFATQAETLAAFRPPLRELFRPAAPCDFTRPPHPGRLQYEAWGFPLDGARWRGSVALFLQFSC